MSARYGYTWKKGVAPEGSERPMTYHFNGHKPERSEGQWLGTRRVDDVSTAGYREYWYEGYRLGCIHPEGKRWRWVSLCGLIADGVVANKEDAKQRVQDRADLSMMTRHGGIFVKDAPSFDELTTEFG